jgi:P4 family phage/plasmid primase-like protien
MTPLPEVPPKCHLWVAKPDDAVLGDLLAERLRAGGNLVHDQGSLYQYDPARGVWAAIELHAIRNWIAAWSVRGTVALKCPVRGDTTEERQDPTNQIWERLRLSQDRIVAIHRRIAEALTEPRFFDGAAEGMAFADGFVVLDHGRLVLRQHSPDHRARAWVQIDWLGSSQPPVAWLRYLDEVFASAADKHDRIRLVGEFMAVALFGIATRYQRAVLGVGAGNNGKSVLVGVLQTLFEPALVSCVEPRQMAQDYQRALLASSALNVVDDLPAQRIDDAGALKAIITGGRVSARQIYQAPFAFTPRAAHFFGANRLPTTADVSEGFFRRLVVLRFDETFSRANRHLGQQLAAEREGIIRWALQHLPAVVARGALIEPLSSRELAAAWRGEQDTVAAWLASDAVEWPPSARTPAQALHSAYAAWCAAEGVMHVSQRELNARLRARAIASVNHAGRVVWVGIAPRSAPTAAAPAPVPASTITDAQVKLLSARLLAQHGDLAAARAWLASSFGRGSSREVTEEEYPRVLAALDALAAQSAN